MHPLSRMREVPANPARLAVASNSPSPGRRREREREKGGRQPSQRAMLAKALQRANTAVLLDNAHNFEGAVDSYSDACTLLQQVMLRSPEDEDRQKLEAVRKTYLTRIDELKSAPLQERRSDKALPARPESQSPEDRHSSRSSMSISDESIVIETARVERVGQDSPHGQHRPALAPLNIAARPGRLMPSPIEEDPLSASTLRTPRPESVPFTFTLTNEPSPPRTNTRTSVSRQLVRQSPSSPPIQRRPVSPAITEAKSRSQPAGSDMTLSVNRLRLPDLRPDSRDDSNETTSWLDTIDESGASSPSSVHLSSSPTAVVRHQPHMAANASNKNAEFDAAIDAAVEAAYDTLASPDDQPSVMPGETSPPTVFDARRKVELARERVREAEREAAILQARERSIRRNLEAAEQARRNQRAELDADARQQSDEEWLLDEVTRGFAMGGFEYGPQFKSALSRQPNSSGFTGRSMANSANPNSVTAALTQQTPSDLSAFSAVPQDLRSSSPPLPPPSGALPAPPAAPSAHPVPPNPALPPAPPASSGQPTGKTTRPPSTVDPLAPGVRHRRLSGQNLKPLKIDVGNKQGPASQAPSTSIPSSSTAARSTVPPPPRTSSVIPVRPFEGTTPVEQEQAPALAPTAVPPNLSSPDTAPSSAKSAMPLGTPGLSKLLTPEAKSGVSPGPPSLSPGKTGGIALAVSGVVRKNASYSSLKNRNLSVSSPDESDISPSTPTVLNFSVVSSGVRRGPVASMPTPSLPPITSGHFSSPSLDAFNLFNIDVHSLFVAGAPQVPRAEHPPEPLEPCPMEGTLRPFWMMRCLYQTLTHPQGGYLTTKMFVPRDVWQFKSSKIKAVEEKVANCDFLTAALQKLAKVDTCDADAVLEEMQAFELVLDQVQTSLSKKLGSDVGTQGLATLFRDGGGGDTSQNSESSTAKSSYSVGKPMLAWRRLRTKTSGSGLTSSMHSNEQSKDGLFHSSLPMTTDTSLRTLKRENNLLPFTGPNAVYMSSLARLFDAAQVLDEIARRVEDPGLKHSSSTHVGLELSSRHAADFFAFYICRFVQADLMVLLDKYIKRGTEWAML